MGAGGADRCRVREAYLWACHLDVAVRKPGNVSQDSAGHGMRAEQFLASASASAGPLLRRGSSVGERIEGAVEATHEAVGCNTNLGIVLLCAPLALAHEQCGEFAQRSLRTALKEVLQGLTVADARAAYRAITLASPAGLGQVDAQNVGSEPTVTLRAAMRLAASRDRIARQYDSGYEDIFWLGLGQPKEPNTAARSVSAHVQRIYLEFLASDLDSHIVRKLDCASAQIVTDEAAEWLARLRERPDVGRGQAFAAWDRSLKRRGFNPGTSADMTVCSLFVAALANPGLSGRTADENWHGNCMESLGGDAAGTLARGSSRGACPKN